MGTKFTKGDWSENKGSIVSNADVVGNIICDCPFGFEESMEQWQYNKKLIISAPKLFEALISIENDNGSIPKAIWDLRNEAIKLATE